MKHNGDSKEVNKLKRMAFVPCLIMISILSACQSLPIISTSRKTPSPTKKPLFTQPLALVPPTTTATWWVTPKITATPVAAIVKTSDDLYNLLKKLYPMYPCIGYNYANSSSPQAISNLEFIEVDVQPEPKSYWVSEVADNFEKSRQAFVACEPESCQDKIYVKFEQTEKVYEVDWEWRMPWRPIQLVIWINNDILEFFQSSNPEQGQIIVINVEKREYLYTAIVIPDNSCATPTPTCKNEFQKVSWLSYFEILKRRLT